MKIPSKLQKLLKLYAVFVKTVENQWISFKKYLALHISKKGGYQEKTLKVFPNIVDLYRLQIVPDFKYQKVIAVNRDDS